MSKWPTVPLEAVVSSVERPEIPIPGKPYRQVGVRLWGEGAYERELLDGGETKYKTLSRVEADDIVVNKIWARNGSVAVVSNKLAGSYVSGEFPTFKPAAEKLEPRWFHWLTKTPTFWEQCDAKSRGTSGKNRIRPERFLEIKIPLPPLPEQRRIVTRIESLATKIQEASSLRQQITDESEMLWQRDAHTLFEKLVEDYPLRPLAEVVIIRGGGTPSKSDPFYWDGQIPWVTPKDMKVRGIYDTIDHISERATQETAAKLIQPGAVLVVVRGMILAHTFPSSVLYVSATINQDMKALIPIREILPEYLCALLWAHNPNIIALVEKSTHDTRKLETFKLLNIKIAVPPVSTQRSIVASLDDFQVKVDALKKLQAESAAELAALLPSILDKAFKGEL